MSSDDYAGRTLDSKYQLTELLGEGGMGAVYKGRHMLIGKTVAVKFLHADFVENEQVVKRFYQEARAAAAIGHPSIIDVLDVGVSPNNEPYLVMEYLEGESLAEMLIRTGPIGLEAALGVLEPVLTALNAAHSKGIVHRDLKPDNIFLVHREGEPPAIKLIDFGISKFATDFQGEKLTQTGSVMGTPSYMAPEQAQGSKELDHRADIYAMGVVLYEMLTGKLPFTGENFTAIVIKIITEDPVPPAEAYGDFPLEAEPLLMRALVKDPAGRYQSALDFMEAIKSLDEYVNRQERLTHLAAGIKKTTFASGDLGTVSVASPGKGGSVASDVLSKVIGDQTAAGWTDTVSKTPKRGSFVAAVLIVSVLAIGIAVGSVYLLGDKLGLRRNEAPVVPVAVPALPAIESVEIRLEGVPAGATVRYGDRVVEGEVLIVQKDNMIITLEISAPGYQVYKTKVVPQKDRLLRVEMKSLESLTDIVETSVHDENGSGERKSSRTRRNKRRSKAAAKVVVPAETPVPPPVPKPGTMVDGARGTKIKTSFE